MSLKVLTLLLLLALLKCGTAVRCYHCYDLYNGNAVTFVDSFLNDKLVKCSQKQKDWNSWECPPDWPVCMIMSLTSKNNYEVVRTCAVKDFCSLYVPVEGAKMDYCRECDAPLCNDFTSFPVPSNNSELLFNFNINLHVNKYFLKNYENEDSKE